MSPEQVKILCDLILSENLTERLACFSAMLDSCNNMLYESVDLISKHDDRKNDTSIIAQKSMLHGYSMVKLIEGVDVRVPDLKRVIQMPDPMSIVVVFRALLESYLTLNHINFAPDEEEIKIRYYVWTYFGLTQRSKIAPTILPSEESKRVLEEEKRTIEYLKTEIVNCPHYLSLAVDKQKTFLENIAKDWKISFHHDSYKKLGWHELINNTGLKPEYSAETYRFLSWYAHSTSISIYQLRDMYKDSYCNFLIKNIVSEAAYITAMLVADLVKIDENYRSGYFNLKQEYRDLINVFNHLMRGPEFVIEPLE